MIVQVDTTSPTPPYEQMRGQLARLITAGVLGPGTQLPPIRQLAADLGLAANTVARAYRELETEGLVVSRVRHGTTVANHPPRLAPAEIQRQLDDAAASFAAVVRQLGVSTADAESAVQAQLGDS